MNVIQLDSSPQTILRARIALLATAIGGPDYTSSLDPPPYKHGDDCLACLKDLKRWFKLVDDQQNRWDVAMAAAEYKIFTDDLIPILIDWESKSSLAAKLLGSDSNNADSNSFKNKIYYDKIALNCLQLMVLMTWPLILTDQSSYEQVTDYSELKKHQLIYKKSVLTVNNGKVFKAVLRLAFNVIKIDKMNRTARDNTILRLVLNFLRNIIAIEPGELSITTKKRSTKGIGSTDTLPPNVSLDDISLNTVITSFHKNKVFKLLLTLGSSISSEFDQDFINLPLLEVMFYLTKDVNQEKLFNRKKYNQVVTREGNERETTSKNLSSTGLELSQLLSKEKQLKTNVIKNTSSRHSRFGALLSIATPDNGRLTVSGSKALLNDVNAMNKLDSRKRWNKRIMKDKDDIIQEGLPNSLLNSQGDITAFFDSTLSHFKHFINDFIDSSFNPVLDSVTNHFTTEQDQMVSLEQVEYLLFFAWFTKYQILRYNNNEVSNFLSISSIVKEISFILMTSLLRTGVEEKNWIVAHAGIIAFNELLSLTQVSEDEENYEEIEYILSRLFSDDRIQLLSNLPKIAEKHSIQFMKNTIELTHTVLKTLQKYSGDKSLMIERRNRQKKENKFSLEEINSVMERDDIGRDEAVEMLTSTPNSMEVNFGRVLGRYINESTINSYLKFLERFRELEDSSIKKVISFFHRVFVDSKDEALFFRIDLIVLFRDMLSTDGLSRSSPSRKPIENFSNYFLARLKKKLKMSPAWFVGLLFPPLHDNEVGYFQRYGELKQSQKNMFDAVAPSRFRSIENENKYSNKELRNLKFGILVSTLLDDGKIELIDSLLTHISDSINILKNKEINNSSEATQPAHYSFNPDDLNILEATAMDRDFRALLKLIGYVLSNNREEKCYLTDDIDLNCLLDDLEMIKFHKAAPFETPNGKPSSSYLIRPRLTSSNEFGIEEDGWNSNEEYDHNDPLLIDDIESNDNKDNDYFKDLQGMSNKLSGRAVSKGIAKSKKKRKISKGKGNNLPTFDVEGKEIVSNKRMQISSKEFISDSEDDEELDPIFFENEMYMRLLLDKHSGQLSNEKYEQFNKFAQERMNNKGTVNNDYTELFDGEIPNIKEVSMNELSTTSPDKSLKSRNTVITQQMSEHQSSQLEVLDNLSNSANNDSDDELDIPFNNNDTDLSDDDLNSLSEGEQESSLATTVLDNDKKRHKVDNTDLSNTNNETNFVDDEEVIAGPRKRQHIFIDEDE